MIEGKWSIDKDFGSDFDDDCNNESSGKNDKNKKVDKGRNSRNIYIL